MNDAPIVLPRGEGHDFIYLPSALDRATLEQT
jgi:hypothetical protein